MKAKSKPTRGGKARQKEVLEIENKAIKKLEMQKATREKLTEDISKELLSVDVNKVLYSNTLPELLEAYGYEYSRENTEVIYHYFTLYDFKKYGLKWTMTYNNEAMRMIRELKPSQIPLIWLIK